MYFLFVTRDKGGSSFEMRVVILIGGGLVYEGCREDSCIFSFLSILDTLSLVHWSYDHLVIANVVFMLIY